MTIWKFLLAWPPFLPSTEGKTIFASNSEKRRWIERGSIQLDGEKAEMNDWIFPDTSIILHPKSNTKRTTLQ